MSMIKIVMWLGWPYYNIKLSREGFLVFMDKFSVTEGLGTIERLVWFIVLIILSFIYYKLFITIYDWIWLSIGVALNSFVLMVWLELLWIIFNIVL